MNILVVDDCKEVIEITTNLLEAKGHSVVVADFEHAMECFLKNEINCVLVNADPSKYTLILNFCVSARIIAPTLYVLIWTLSTDDVEIKFLELSGAKVFSSLKIIDEIAKVF
jgi:DNA-binding response OmpR family regulator